MKLFKRLEKCLKNTSERGNWQASKLQMYQNMNSLAVIFIFTFPDRVCNASVLFEINTSNLMCFSFFKEIVKHNFNLMAEAQIRKNYFMKRTLPFF